MKDKGHSFSKVRSCLEMLIEYFDAANPQALREKATYIIYLDFKKLWKRYNTKD